MSGPGEDVTPVKSAYPEGSVEDAVEKIRRDRFVGLAKWSAALAAAWYQQRVRRVDFDPAETADDIVSERLRFLEAWEQDAFRRVLKTNLEGLKAGRVPVSTVPPPPSHDLADPVEHARGEFVHEATDLVVRGAGVDFAFHRTYRHQTAFDGPLGSRWDHGYNLFLLIDEENATLATGGGRLERYRRHASWGQAAGCDYYVPPDGVDATLEPIGVHDAPGGWARRGPDGLRHVFEPEPHWSGGFRLARIEDRWGNNLRLTYVDRPNGQVRLGRVYVNHDARWVQFSYDELDRIVRLEDHTGRAWRYRYDTHGDLIGVTTPATPDQPRGATTEYRYSSAERTGPLAHLLTDIFDAEGRHYLHTTYGVDQGQPDYNRVIQQRVGTGDYQFRYQPVESPDLGLAAQDRPTMQCWVKERNGFQTLYVYNEWGSLLWKQETDKGPGHAPRQVVWRYRYNRDGALIASRTPEGVVRHVLTGRDHFLCAYGVATADPSAEALWQRAALTADERRGFGRVLATVERAAPHVAVSFGWADRWGDVYAVEPGDLVVKYTYEPAYGQPLTTSDPRTTTASDPRVPEPPAYHRLLTRFEYSAAPKHALVRVVRPTPTLPTLPNGTLGADVVSEILERDPRGRVTQLRDPLGVESTTEYLGEAEGARAGFGWRTTIDPGDRALGKLALTTEHEVDELGRVTATTLPRGVDSADRRFVVRTKYDALDRVVKAWAATPLATETRTRYEAAGKPARIEINWIGPGGEHHGVIVQRFAYDEEHRLRQEWQGGEDPTGHRRATHRYNAAGQKTVTIAANDTATIWKYDSRDLLARTIRGPGVDESIEVVVRDRDGRVIEQRSAEGRVTLITYDAFGRAVATTDGLGHVTRVSYDRGGRPTVVRRFERVADGAGNVRFQLLARSEAIYDELGRACREVHSRFDVPPPLVTEAALARALRVGAGVRARARRRLPGRGRVGSCGARRAHAASGVADRGGAGGVVAGRGRRARAPDGVGGGGVGERGQRAPAAAGVVDRSGGPAAADVRRQRRGRAGRRAAAGQRVSGAGSCVRGAGGVRDGVVPAGVRAVQRDGAGGVGRGVDDLRGADGADDGAAGVGRAGGGAGAAGGRGSGAVQGGPLHRGRRSDPAGDHDHAGGGRDRAGRGAGGGDGGRRGGAAADAGDHGAAGAGGPGPRRRSERRRHAGGGRYDGGGRGRGAAGDHVRVGGPDRGGHGDAPPGGGQRGARGHDRQRGRGRRVPLAAHAVIAAVDHTAMHRDHRDQHGKGFNVKRGGADQVAVPNVNFLPDVTRR